MAARLAGAWLALIALISLNPLTGWRDSGVALAAFVWAPLPRIVPTVDLIGNLLAYCPLGVLLYLMARERLSARAAFLSALLVGSGFSLTMEALQAFLPNRVPSNLDWLANSAGLLVGALLGARWAPRVAPGGSLERRWQHIRAAGRGQEGGVAVLGLWLLAQWSPAGPLFAGNGLRQLLGLPGPGAFSPERFIAFETVAVAAGGVAAAVLVALMLRRYRLSAAVLLLAAGILARISGHLALDLPGSSWTVLHDWATPGTLRGLLLCLPLAWLTLRLRPRWKGAVAVLCLMVGTLIGNLMPDNPYLMPNLPAFPAAQWLNLDGLSRLAAVVWPLMALVWLFNLRSEE